MGLAISGAGVHVANKTKTIYPSYLEREDKLALFDAADSRASTSSGPSSGLSGSSSRM